MITIKKGDLLNATERIIAHQVNCYGAVGGLAADIFKKWPDAENDYRQVCERLGPLGMIPLGMAQLTGQQKDGHIICNLFGQNLPGADYNRFALTDALKTLGNIARQSGWSVALPYKLSCGICGGNWVEVYNIIETTMYGVECVIYQREGDE